MPDFKSMTQDEAIEYLSQPSVKNAFIGGFVDEDGARQYDCLMVLVEDGTVKPSELPDYGVE